MLALQQGNEQSLRKEFHAVLRNPYEGMADEDRNPDQAAYSKYLAKAGLAQWHYHDGDYANAYRWYAAYIEDYLSLRLVPTDAQDMVYRQSENVRLMLWIRQNKYVEAFSSFRNYRNLVIKKGNDEDLISRATVDIAKYALLRNAGQREYERIRPDLLKFEDLALDYGKSRRNAVFSVFVALGKARAEGVEAALPYVEGLSSQQPSEGGFQVIARIIEGCIYAVNGNREMAQNSFIEAIELGDQLGMHMDFNQVVELLNREEFKRYWPDTLDPRHASFMFRFDPVLDFTFRAYLKSEDGQEPTMKINHKIRAFFNLSS